MTQILHVHIGAVFSVFSDMLGQRYAAPQAGSPKGMIERHDIIDQPQGTAPHAPRGRRGRVGDRRERAGSPRGVGGLWVLPRPLEYTGAKGAKLANVLNFSRTCCCSFGFGRHAR